jgi:hypothetical protein
MAFRDDLAKYAEDMGKKYDILPSFMCGVAILETGNGTSQLCRQAHNLFSIKGTYNGAFIQLPTAEYYNGMRTTVEANFRKYPDYGASFQDFCDLMENGVTWDRNKYKIVIGQKDIKQLCHDFAHTGFMTDPNYESKLWGVIQQYSLTDFDPKPNQPPLNTAPSTGAPTSIIDYLKSRGINSSFDNRQKLATLMNVANYAGTADQNSTLLYNLQINAGKKYLSIIDYMKDHRMKTNLPLLADFLDVPDYKGTAKQNVTMLKKLGAQ